jgi:adenylosuccinate synthase
VIRTFPIRVGGTSGDLPNEISWELVRAESGADLVEQEFTSVTKTLRRVARFDLDLVHTACRYNRPTSLAVMGLDRIDVRNRGASDVCQLTEYTIDFLATLESELELPINWLGTGFDVSQAIAKRHSTSESLVRV